MAHTDSSRGAGEAPPASDKSIEQATLIGTLVHLWPYIWPGDRADLKMRVVWSMVLLLVAKLATLSVPFTFKWAIDALTGADTAPVQSSNWTMWLIASPLIMTVSYGAVRVLMAVLTQWRDGIFARVAMHAVRKLAYLTFVHMHELSLRFHLERKTGGLTRVLERGRLGIEVIVRMVILQLVPTIVEVSLLMGVLLWQFDWRYVLVTMITVVIFMYYTYIATEWRIEIRRKMNDSDTEANTKAIDSLSELRDGQIFRRRGARSHALRPFDGALRARQREDLYLAGGAQYRAGGHLHRRPHRDHADVRDRRAQRHQYGRRFRHGQRHDDPALPAAEFHGHGLSRDQAGGDRHREDVRRAVAQSGDQGCSRRQAADRDVGQCALRRCAVLLRSRASDPQGSQLRGAGRQDGRDRRAVRRRQIDHLAAAVSPL